MMEFEGRYFDGKSAVAAAASVAFAHDCLHIRTADLKIQWAYRDVQVLNTSSTECRLGYKPDPDAVLVLPVEARVALEDISPEFHSGEAARRKFTGAVVLMVGAAAAIAALLFIGIPAASGPMAQATPKHLESQIGENMAAQITTVFRRCRADEALDLVRPVITDMAAASDVGFDIEFHFVRTRAPNAFALPGGQVMATSGLLNAVGDDQEAFLAVMAHELGHVKARDSMQAFYRNAGLGVLLEIVTGGSGLAQQAVLLGGQLTQLRHGRAQEARADETAFQIMEASGLDPAALARAFEAITGAIKTDTKDDAEGEKSRRPIPSWLNSHPDTGKRIEASRKRSNPGGTKLFTDDEWETIRAACNKTDDKK